MEIGVPELLVVLVIIILLFGPGRLINVGRELGESIRNFRQGLQDPAQETETPGEELVSRQK